MSSKMCGEITLSFEVRLKIFRYDNEGKKGVILLPPKTDLKRRVNDVAKDFRMDPEEIWASMEKLIREAVEETFKKFA